MTNSNLSKRIKQLECQNEEDHSIKHIIWYSRNDYKEKLKEIEELRERGEKVFPIIIVSPGEHAESSEWGEHLRKNKQTENK